MNRKYTTQEAENLAKKNEEIKENLNDLRLAAIATIIEYERDVRSLKSKVTALWICLVLVSSVLVYVSI